MILGGLATLFAAAAGGSVAVPAGTPMSFVTIAPISSRSVKQGQRFPLQVSEDVTMASQTVIPKGTAAVGEVEAVSGTGMFGKAGNLVLRPLFIDIRGEHVNLVGATADEGHDGTAAAAITTALIGGFGLMITGKSAVVPAGSRLYGRVRTDVRLPVTTQGASSSN
jgi:hypothetical protein